MIYMRPRARNYKCALQARNELGALRRKVSTRIYSIQKLLANPPAKSDLPEIMLRRALKKEMSKLQRANTWMAYASTQDYIEPLLREIVSLRHKYAHEYLRKLARSKHATILERYVPMRARAKQLKTPP